MAKQSSPRVVVVGAFNLDLVFWAERRPERGETIVGERFGMFPGGKGFNQAVAAARLGARVTMIGRLGTDPFADPFLETLASEGIESHYVLRDQDRGTGVASPLIEADGSNSIVMVPTSELGSKYSRLDHTTYFSRLDVTIKSKDVIYATIYSGMTIKLNMGNPLATIE